MKIDILHGDITTLKVDVIVNAANNSLLGGGGVDGAIHRAGGPDILAECQAIRKKQGGCPTGEAVITTAGKLKAGFVIHTVGPIWQGGQQNEDGILKNCYFNSLRLAEEHSLHTIAFPNISTGVYGFPKRRAADIALHTVQQHQATILQQVIFVCFDEENYQIYRELAVKEIW